MKKITLSLLCATLVAGSIVGCGTVNTTSENSPAGDVKNEEVSKTDNKDDSNTSENNQTEEVAKFSLEPEILINGHVVAIGSNMDETLLGDTTDYDESPSCFGEGMDKTFYYGPISVYTNPSDGKDLIYRIAVDPEGELLSGIIVGTTTKDEVIELYKDSCVVSDGIIECERENGIVMFEIDEESGIVLSADMGIK